MNIIKTRNLNDMCIIPHSDLDEDILFNTFLKSNGNIIYITENDGRTLFGVISLGDFKRYLRKVYASENITGIINQNCAFFYESDEKSAESFLLKHKKIHSVPIIDDSKRLIKEYYEEYLDSNLPDNSGISSEVIRQAVMDAGVLLTRYRRIIFFVNKLDDNVVPDRLSDKILVLSSINLTDFIDLGNDICVYEFRRQVAVDLFSIICKKRGIDYRLIHPAISCYSKQDIYLQMQLYNSIGIFANTKDYFSEAEKYNSNIHWLDITSINYNAKEDLYEYTKAIDGDIECIFMPIAFFTKLAYADKIQIPVFSMIFTSIACTYTIDETIIPEMQAQDYDIAYNIIPKFRESGIKYLILENPDNEYTKIPPDIMLHMKNIHLTKNSLENMIMYDDAKEFLEEQERMPFIISERYFRPSIINGKYFRVSNEERYTKGNPEVYSNTIYLFGPCFIFGTFVKDEDTIGSYLSDRTDKYYVKNCGTSFASTAFKARDEYYQSGDIVIIMVSDSLPYRENGIEVTSLLNVYRQIPNLKEHISDSLLHVNRYVTRHIADFIYDKISGWFNKEVTFGNRNKKDFPDQLEKWLVSVQKYKVMGKKAGAIVMNANPFTKGHRYLVEEACKKVEVLYIFVVQEDKSFFSFSDRLTMVQLGTDDIPNVVVIPSGSYIISTATLPGYFDKETMPEAEFDATEDLETFCKIIAPVFDITVRFAGTEPDDNFTRRYNEFMSDILPKNGVKFCEIPRKKQNGEVISASRVRKYLEQNQYDSINDLVLPEIYEYLKQLK